jgi:CubicO group peptidase (beta-lactamase class C family)
MRRVLQRFLRSSTASALLTLAAAGVLLSCGGGGGAEDAPAAADRYPAAAAQGIDPRGLEAAYATFGASPYSRCLLVERHGVLVMEEYFNGNTSASSFDVRSVTKSVTSVLVGIAIDQGLIRSLDQTIGDFLTPVVPALEPQTARIPIRDLLTMTSGIPWRELNSAEQDYSAWVTSSDPLVWILSRPLEAKPGQLWNYNTGASHVLSALLSEAAGVSARAFAQDRLFGPMDSEVGGWLADPRGYNYGGHGISLTGRAMVKLGRLFLDGGAYRGRQIVSTAWVRESTTLRYSTREAVAWGSGYGYQWWLGRDSRTGLDFYFAMGYGGQFIVNVPARNATIAAATAWSGVSNAGDNWYLVLRTIVETILPSLR